MIADEIRELLNREPFEAFRFHLTSGTTFDVRDANCVALGQKRVFIAFTNADRQAYFPYIHVAAVETLGSGHGPRTPRRKRRP
ncbi:MAG: hypothetical protein IT449_06685 [Phycisphaerales bacterium]|nr:hypothetical protein [Phycisphaerales bacterium]